MTTTRAEAKKNMLTKSELRRCVRNRDKRDRNKRFCHYCGIEEKDFRDVWGVFRGGRRGKHLEIDHKDGAKTNDKPDNCVLACYACNNAKSDVFSYDEFKMVGEVISQIYQEKAVKLNVKLTKDPN